MEPIKPDIELELKIFALVKKHIESSLPFQDPEIMLTGGVFVKPRPKAIRSDLIELNSPGLGHFKPSKVLGFINVNYQHEDLDIIHLKHPVIMDVMDDAIIGKYHFNQFSNEVFRISKYLWWGNTHYKVTEI